MTINLWLAIFFISHQVALMKSLKGIESFIEVARLGSFSAAAKQLGVSAVAVSKNVATLERQLGVRLFQRTTRKLNLTAEGQNYYEQCLGPLRELEAAQAVVQNSSTALSGLVRITSATPFGTGFILPMLPKFQTLHPKVQISLHLDDAVNDLIADSYDIGIRVGQLRDSSLVARPISPLPFVVCASPSYLVVHGMPSQLEDLKLHNCLRLSRAGNQEPMPWFLKGCDIKLDRQIIGNLLINDFSSLLTAAVQGQGLVCVPLPLAMPMFRSGQLQPVLPDLIESKIQVYLYYPNRQNLPARTRGLIDFILAQLKQEKDLQTPAQLLITPFLKPNAKAKASA
jgi:DNA-binding transcriptional LysR family regulator